MKTVFVILQMVLGIVVPLTIQWLDRKRLPFEVQQRTWNRASWCCALWAFGPLSMIAWGWITRRWLGLALGLLTTIFIFGFLAAIQWLYELFFSNL